MEESPRRRPRELPSEGGPLVVSAEAGLVWNICPKEGPSS